jgi:ABC-type transport system substrate-binding protein
MLIARAPRGGSKSVRSPNGRAHIAIARLSTLLLVASATAGCTKVAPSNPLDQSANHRHPYTIPHTLRIGDATEYASLNPHLDINSWRLADLTMAWLLRSGADDRPRPELALEVPSRANGGVSRDGRTIVYHLRHGARWSDGAPFTARDVIFSTRVAMDPRTNEQARSYFANISNVTSPNRYTVVVHLLRPMPEYSITTSFRSARRASYQRIFSLGCRTSIPRPTTRCRSASGPSSTYVGIGTTGSCSRRTRSISVDDRGSIAS